MQRMAHLTRDLGEPGRFSFQKGPKTLRFVAGRQIQRQDRARAVSVSVHHSLH